MFLKLIQRLVGFTCLCPVVASVTVPTGATIVNTWDPPLTDTEPNVPLSTTTGVMSSLTQCSGASFREPYLNDCLEAIRIIQLTPNASTERIWSPTRLFLPSVHKSCQISLIPLYSRSEDVFSFALIGNTASDIALRCSSFIFGRVTRGGKQVLGPKQMFYVSVGLTEAVAR